MSIKLSELKKLYDKGLDLIYLQEESKKPIGAGWTTKPKKRWGELEREFSLELNAGVRLGHKLPNGNYIAALDADVKAPSKQALKELNAALGSLGVDLESAPTVLSGRGNGSKHIYIQTREPLQPMKFATSEVLVKVMMPKQPFSKRDSAALTVSELDQGYRMRAAWEIGFMGVGQQTVLPGSKHPDSGELYEWQNGFSEKFLPLFDPTPFVASKQKSVDILDLDFQAVDVDLKAKGIDEKLIHQIESGDEVFDRSAFLMKVAMIFCMKGFTNNETLSVLSDRQYWLGQAAYEHTQSSNRARAIKWLNKYTLTKARAETDVKSKFDDLEPLEDLSPEEISEVKEKIDEKESSELPDVTKQGMPKVTFRNTIHVIERMMKENAGSVGYDEFQNRALFLKNTPYGGVKGRELQDIDDLKLCHYIASHFGFEPSQDMCFKAHVFVAEKYKFHPVRDFISSLRWDGIPRLDMWLVNAFGATGPNEYLRAVSRKTLIAAIARIFEPGCKFDHVTILEGFQGKGKSTALRILCGNDKWFTDGLGDLFTKDVVDQMAGKWIIELGELASVRKAEINATKAFLSRQTDRVRLPYGKRSADFPRQSIFIGSTNDDEYMLDETGNRRFWPVKIEQADFKWIEENREQLWAEARHAYRMSEEIWLSPEIEALAVKEQSKRLVTDEWTEVIKEYLDSKEDPTRTTTKEIYQNPLGYMAQLPDDRDAKRIGKSMRLLGYVRAVFRLEGISTKGWRKYGEKGELPVATQKLPRKRQNG